MTEAGGAFALLRADFADEIHARIDALEALLAEQALATAVGQAHRLKGSALVLGLSAVVAELQTIETALRSDPPDLDRARAALSAARAAAVQELGAPPAAGAHSSLATAKHDLITPLNVIVGYAQLLQLAELGDREHEYVEAIALAADRLEAMIAGLGAPTPDVSTHGPAAPVPGALDRGPHRTVLLIEDDPTNVRLVERLFEERPAIELVVARSGEDGLLALARERPELVLLDLGLEDTPGVEVLRRIGEIGDPGLRVVVVSGDDSPELRRELVEAGAAGFLPKPIVVQGLLHLLDGMSARRPE